MTEGGSPKLPHLRLAVREQKHDKKSMTYN